MGTEWHHSGPVRRAAYGYRFEYDWAGWDWGHFLRAAGESGFRGCLSSGKGVLLRSLRLCSSADDRGRKRSRGQYRWAGLLRLGFFAAKELQIAWRRDELGTS